MTGDGAAAASMVWVWLTFGGGKQIKIQVEGFPVLARSEDPKIQVSRQKISGSCHHHQYSLRTIRTAT